MRNDYLQNALLVITEPNILINVVSRRVKQLRQGARPLVVSLEKLAAEDIALREIAEGKISYTLARADEGEAAYPSQLGIARAATSHSSKLLVGA